MDDCQGFDTELYLCGPLRQPKQMLDEQEYDGHSSIHDDQMAAKLGFSGAPIEGPTHFSLFPPLLYKLFGKDWFEKGCISVHYQNMVVEGEQVRAFAQYREDANSCHIWAEKKDGTPVLVGTASVGPDHGETELDRRRHKLRPTQQLIVLSDLELGMKGKQSERVVMDFDQHMGKLYPFTLNQKLKSITEYSPWYSSHKGTDSPWGRAIIPLEMISVLVQYSANDAGFPVKGPVVGLFADQEIKLIKGPLFVGQPYRLEREVIALSESKRVECAWTLTRVFDIDSHELVAECILNLAHVKDSFEGYGELAKQIGKAHG